MHEENNTIYLMLPGCSVCVFSTVTVASSIDIAATTPLSNVAPPMILKSSRAKYIPQKLIIPPADIFK